MARWLMLALTLALLPGAAPAQVRWEKNLDAGRQAAAKSGKPLFVDFYADWCGPCRLMERETFTDPAVRELLKGMVCVRVDIDKNEALAKQFEITSIPRMLVLPAKGGAPVMDTTGFRDADRLTAELRQSLGLKAGQGATAESGELARVRQALAAKQYAALKASDAKVAAAGLDQFVAQLGVFKENQLPPLVGLLRNSGDDGIAALVRGLGHPHLAVRAAAHRTLQGFVQERKLAAPPAYDPWSSARDRRIQAQRWAKWWATQPR